VSKVTVVMSRGERGGVVVNFQKGRKGDKTGGGKGGFQLATKFLGIKVAKILAENLKRKKGTDL